MHAALDQFGWHKAGGGRPFVALVAAGGLLLLAGGCGAVKENASDPNLVEGKQLFVAKCGACHTLARAETKGIVGPNLDDAFRVDVAEGLGRNAIHGVVHGQVLEPNSEGAMPKELLHGEQLENVAAYVAYAAARPGADTGLLAAAVAPVGSGKPAVEKSGKLNIAASPTGQLAYTTNKATATAGPVTITMANMSGVTHNLAVQVGTGSSGPILGATKFISKGASSVTVNLKPGKYIFFCQVPGHRQAGMEGTLTVK
jgi:mono/diheme cytochrome c family protein